MNHQSYIERTVEIRADEGQPGFSGYASHFWSVDSYGTAVKPGAFTKTLKERGARVPVLLHHESTKPIGRLAELKQDKTGLAFNAVISEGTTDGRDAMTLLRDGVPLGMSFGFQTIKSRAGTKDDPIDFTQVKAKAEDVQIIEEVRLWEVSLVTFPANEQAAIHNVRAANEAALISTLIEQIRSGSADPARLASIADLVAAYQERQEPKPDDPTSLPAKSARRTDILALIALAQRGHTGVNDVEAR